MKHLKYIGLALAILVTSSCSDFLDVNTDLDLPSGSTPNFLLPAVLANLSTSMFDHGDVTAYFTQQVATNSGYHTYKDRWDYVDANRIAQWRRHFHDVGNNAKNVIATAEEEESYNYAAVGRIAFAFSTLITTDVFGDIPYSEAFRGNPSPKYDTQAFVYQQVHGTLDTALMAIASYRQSPETCRTMSWEQDNVFGGDMDKWEQFAHAVRARALLHMTPWANQNYQEVIDAADLVLNNYTGTEYIYANGNGSSSLQLNQWGKSAIDPGWDYANNILSSSAPTEFMMLNVLKFDPLTNTVTDPRQPLLMQPRYDDDEDPATDPLYLFIEPSRGKDGTKVDADYPLLYGNYITQDLAPMIFIAREEMYFIKAEAAFNKDDKAMAFLAFQNGITEHMVHVGVDAADITAFLAGATVPQTSADLTLSHIMMQKYIATYLQGETWVDMRRYDFDSKIYTGLKRPANLAWYWDDDEDNVWMHRLPYDTETEEIYNKPTLEALGAYQNPDWLKEKMIWAKQ